MLTTYTTPQGRTVLYNNIHTFSALPLSKKTYLFTATPALIDTLISRGSLSPVTPITSR